MCNNAELRFAVNCRPVVDFWPFRKHFNIAAVKEATKKIISCKYMFENFLKKPLEKIVTVPSYLYTK